ncbi:MAG: TonB-dependent receptor [Ignavibacteria bacterium]|jgi:TonB-dependent receptor
MSTKHYVFILLLFFPLMLLAQNGKGNIRGHVISQGDGSELPFANVIVLGTTIGTATDIEGNFFLRNVEAGEVMLEISYVGYESKYEVVEMLPGKTIEIGDIMLSHASIQEGEVVVTAQAEGQMNAINQQVQSNTVKNVVASDRLQENPDANAAEALGRLPGIVVSRSGGEGQGLVIRGLEAKYNTISINGVTLPSTSTSDRSTGISGLSQYVLQGVEVYKALTADMDANSVGGTVELKLREAPAGLHSEIMAYMGYNHQNDELKNYKINVNLSDRFFDEKLGVSASFNMERVNNSTQTMGGSYSIESNTAGEGEYEQLYLATASLNDVDRILNKHAGTLVLDYKASKRSKFMLYGFYSHSESDYTGINKGFTPGSRTISYGINQNDESLSELFSSSLTGEHELDLFEIDYGIAYSQTKGKTPESRSWTFDNSTGFDEEYTTQAYRSLDPSKIINLSNDEATTENLMNTWLSSMGYTTDFLKEEDLNLYYNMKYLFKLTNDVSGYVKMGVKYKHKKRERDYNSYSQSVVQNTVLADLAVEDLDWVEQNGSNVTAMGFDDYYIDDFLDGDYNFGWYPNMDRLNTLFDWWDQKSDYYLSQGYDVWNPVFGERRKVGYYPDWDASRINDQHIKEDYYATYLMSEINFGKMIMFLPGVRYEKLDNELNAAEYQVITLASQEPPYYDTTVTRTNEFFFPMIHLRFQPTDWGHIHFAFTKTLSRPNYDDISPYLYWDNGYSQFYTAGNPELEPEKWTNFDLQFAVYNNTIGLISLNGFYKTVEDKIWDRSYKRLSSDPVIEGFDSLATVTVTQPVNMDFDVHVQGFELEWQTHFWYLPEPFNYFSLNVNYSYIDTETEYPESSVETVQIGTGSTGRPIYGTVRVDTSRSEAMLNQPEDLVNVSLGFNYKGLNMWLSHQTYGRQLTGVSTMEELDTYKSRYSRWDLSIAQKLPIEGLDVLYNWSNINNVMEESYPKADSRPTYLESYGWKMDLGFRYKF